MPVVHWRRALVAVCMLDVICRWYECVLDYRSCGRDDVIIYGACHVNDVNVVIENVILVVIFHFLKLVVFPCWVLSQLLNLDVCSLDYTMYILVDFRVTLYVQYFYENNSFEGNTFIKVVVDPGVSGYGCCVYEVRISVVGYRNVESRCALYSKCVTCLRSATRKRSRTSSVRC